MKAITLGISKFLRLLILLVFFVSTPQAEESNPQHNSDTHNPATHNSSEHANTDEQRTMVNIPLGQQNKIGVKTFKLEQRQLIQRLRTVGIIKTDQSREAHVHARINGWIEQITADSVGKPVKKGGTLFELYSPDLVTTQGEYLLAVKQGPAAKDVADTALNRLRLWSVPATFIDKLVASKQLQRTVSFESPITGVVVDKQAIQGMYVTPDMQLYSLADLSRVWLMITLYEADLSFIKVGDSVELKLPYDPTKKFTGAINYIYPEIDINTRTAKARIEIDNADGFLRPGMFADVEIVKELGESLALPADAIIDTGLRSLVFVKTHQTMFEPKEIAVGPRVDGWVPVLKGLSVGDEVIVSANFLIDAESKLQAVLLKGEASGTSGGGGGHAAHGAK